MALELVREQQVVTPTHTADTYERDYMASYSVGICYALLSTYGEDDFRRWFPGGIEECIRFAQQAADQFFDKWKVKWGPKMAYTLRAMGGGLAR